MKTLQHLSPTSIALYTQNPSEFYLNYLSDNRPPRFPQTKPMSIGSSFDAYAKSYMHEKIFGKGNDPRFEFNAIFEAQVEQHNRDWALVHGEHAFKMYKASGALADLMLELSTCIGTPRFELEIKGTVGGSREGIVGEYDEVILLGKPDVFFINKHGAHVIFDFKVNGYCSNSNTTPMQGFIRCREQKNGLWFDKGSHKGCQPMVHNGVMINIGSYLENFDESWARQLAIYAWLAGCEIGEDFIAAIDQIACRPSGIEKPDMRIAAHRIRISRDFQQKVFKDAKFLWELSKSGHFFHDLDKELSIAKCKLLDGMADSLRGEGSAADQWFASMSRGN